MRSIIISHLKKPPKNPKTNKKTTKQLQIKPIKEEQIMTTQKLHPLQITAYISIILHFIFIVAINYRNNQIPFLPNTPKQPEQTQTQTN
ncbi:hypothetical protein [Candidatus Phytoplasma solani]|uniref:hypothetical protein n=1 Tax=Candidatus Phytoplasma solani TaxID=69896 RepID=UPI0035901BB0